MDAAGDDSADAGDQLSLFGHGDDAGGGADDVDDIALADVRADGVPVGIESADGDGNAGVEAEFGGPFGREMAGDVVGGEVFAAHFGAHAGQQRIEQRRGTLREGSHPTLGFQSHLWPMAQTLRLRSAVGGDAGEGCGDHVAVFECGEKRLRLSGLWRSQWRSLAQPHS